MNSTNATILKIEGRMITLRILNAPVDSLVGKSVKINGLKTLEVESIPCKECDAGKTDLENALLYRVAASDDISSLHEGSVCEATWE